MDQVHLLHIENCDLQHPWGLRVDTRDNLFIAEINKATVKKIQIIIFFKSLYA